MTESLHTGRVALITGAGSGIGRATAVALSSMGFSCVLTGRRYEPLRGTAWLCYDARVITADLRSAAEAERVVDEAAVWRGRLDVVVNNAGWSRGATIAQTDTALIQEVFALNAIAPAVIIARAWQHLVASSTAQKPGVVVNVSSMATRDPYPQLYAYAAAKASVNLLALSTARAGLEHHIQSYSVAPGAVETDLLRSIVDEENVPRDRALAPEAVAQVIAECVGGSRVSENGGTLWITAPGG
jgi:NAD(P)-dependent dehydrogenase (short-subunit alcohol dehydrogenase family)